MTADVTTAAEATDAPAAAVEENTSLLNNQEESDCKKDEEPPGVTISAKDDDGTKDLGGAAEHTVAEETQSRMPPNEAELGAGAGAEGASGDAPVTESTPLAASADGVDPVKVKFVAGADAKLEMGAGADPEVAVKTAGDESEFRAMTKAELMKYAKDPKWIAIRWALFVLFWIAWVAMLVGAVVIIIKAPKCPTPAPKQWWQKAPIYQVYVKSFKDSDGDGIGDLKGVESKLDYLQGLGVGTVALSPFFPSPMVDNGYDIKDFQDVAPEFGTLEGFKSLLAGAHERDLKVVIDFVPNHTSKQHPWFEKSVKKEEPYTDFYVWQNSEPAGGPPNNWKSVFGGPAWTLNEERGQYYLHQFMADTPDLNLNNEEVRKRLKDALKFWLDLGVDGFRVDGVAHFYEDPTFVDEPAVPGADADSYKSVEHTKTFDLPKNLELLKQFREVLDAKTAEDEYNPRIMMTEAYLSVDDLGKYYGQVVDQIGSISHMPINFGLVELPKGANVTDIHTKLTTYTEGLPLVAKDEEANVVDTGAEALSKAWSNFNTGNHDNSRMATRFGEKLIDGVNMLVMLMQGTPITYYGDEIGMQDGVIADQEEGSDNRSPYRTPMQWTPAGPNAGFSSAAESWLPVDATAAAAGINVETQSSAGSSHLHVFKTLAGMRLGDAVLYGETEFIHEGNVLGFTRVKKGNPGLIVVVNFGDSEAAVDVSNLKNVGGDDAKGNLVLRSSEQFKEEEVEQSVNMKEVKLMPKEGKVINFVPKFVEE